MSTKVFIPAQPRALRLRRCRHRRPGCLRDRPVRAAQVVHRRNGQRGNPGGKSEVIAGSPTLVRSLLKKGLVDELRLLLFPIVLGKGKHLFDGWEAEIRLKLVGSRSFRTACSRSRASRSRTRSCEDYAWLERAARYSSKPGSFGENLTVMAMNPNGS